MSEQAMWVVERKGVYGAGVCGAFSTLEAAKQAVEEHVRRSQEELEYEGYKEADGDGYHAFHVEKRPVGMWTEYAAARHIYECRVGRSRLGEKSLYVWRPEEMGDA